MDLRLTIELVPSSAWGNNLRDLMAKEAWDTMRRQVYKQYKYHCGICNAGNTTMYCHEIWQYDDETWTQKLTGFIALCKMCHHCKHLGHANILAQKGELDYEQVVQHFIRVNQCSRQTPPTPASRIPFLSIELKMLVDLGLTAWKAD